ncbi:hypothetical protein [Actinomycetospora sp. NBRC 106378]|uniref:hypothetical protein n=1 Tax=Actinomycetospora sp. NBRC 106378 TaxID=3032208 RepID=UPI0024A3EF95|nr:hypothetical protein [Actinomycetospora sp. NBRC 106378]GLZ52483.1 hypothetical protein Acsp07_21000 [Actinomycetospora sp. NBRC 106378]
MTRSRLLVATLGVVALVLAVVVGLLARGVVAAARTEDATREATRAAGELTPVLLGYDWRTLDDDVARIDSATTGPFAEQNRAIVASLVVPAAIGTRASSSAAVARVAVVSAAPDRVETLVLYAQTTARGGEPGETVARSARVVLEPGPDERWLVAGFDAS